ncbi:hypothetical protein AB0950_18045 [Streptomyces sp. NPDC007189]
MAARRITEQQPVKFAAMERGVWRSLRRTASSVPRSPSTGRMRVSMRSP